MRRWNLELLGWAAVGLGVGVLLGGWLGGVAGTAAVWVAMLVPMVIAVRRGMPRGLLSFRAIDLLYGLVLGCLLRIMQGWLATAFGGSGALPAYPSLNGALPSLWWAQDLVGGVLVAPVIEEFFFRGLLLVAIFTVVRRFAGREGSAAIGVGGFVAVVATMALFVIMHALVAPVTPDDIVSLMLLGLVCGMLVAFTGRIWPAVLVHVVYNGTGVLLTVAGTLLA